ncbi:hypothetical protein OH492_14135 [Vibrio chagasii]|nr:hypothetical protein [Vibrio chagasii]
MRVLIEVHHNSDNQQIKENGLLFTNVFIGNSIKSYDYLKFYTMLVVIARDRVKYFPNFSFIILNMLMSPFLKDRCTKKKNTSMVLK